MHSSGTPMAREMEFQSTPPVSGRRCAAEMAGSHGSVGFNPRPPFPGGDAATVKANKNQVIFVSIHAPRFREAMPGLDVCNNRLNKVSIHAPRFREAMRS